MSSNFKQKIEEIEQYVKEVRKEADNPWPWNSDNDIRKKRLKADLMERFAAYLNHHLTAERGLPSKYYVHLALTTAINESQFAEFIDVPIVAHRPSKYSNSYLNHSYAAEKDRTDLIDGIFSRAARLIQEIIDIATQEPAKNAAISNLAL